MTKPLVLRASNDDKRIGLVALCTDVVVEAACWRIVAPTGARIVTNRILFENPVTPANLAAMESDLERCVRDLLPGELFDSIAFGCSSGSVAIGEDTLRQKIRSLKPGSEVTNPVTAACAAFEKLNVRRISIVTPYSAEINRSVIEYFESKGLEVMGAFGFDVGSDINIARIPPETISAAARKTVLPTSEAVFLSCTALPALDIIESLETSLARPVVTSNQAMAWHLLRLAGIDDVVPGFGQLLTL